MRILFITHSFNSLTQRMWCELRARGHDVSIEFDIIDSVTEEAVEFWKPDLILAPYLRRAIPESVWSKHVCLVVHPGIVGDRGPSAIDWAILEGESEWGVTVLQANAEMDAGDIWAWRTFPLRQASKASIYRNEVTEAALAGVLEALENFEAYKQGTWKPLPLEQAPQHVAKMGQLRPLMKQEDRRIDWQKDSSALILRKLNAADGFPGVRGELLGVPCNLYDAHIEPLPIEGAPGQVVAKREHALLLKTTDSAIWIGHAKRTDKEDTLKLPSTVALAAECADIANWQHGAAGCDEIRYEESTVTNEAGAAIKVGYLHFDFYNGAMSTRQCKQLLHAVEAARQQPTQVLVLMGGRDFWSNGIHLNLIEASGSAADESWENINAIDDVCKAIIETTDKLLISAMRGNAGAGGAYLALTADEVWSREVVILNPHYKNMGNLYGSEYWTYLLPRRMGPDGRRIMQNRLPITAREALDMGLIDKVMAGDAQTFAQTVVAQAEALAKQPDLQARIANKAEQRAADEAKKPLASYREAELANMRRNFFGFDPSYHVARFHFTRKTLHSWTPRHLALHRQDAPERAA